MSGDFAQQVEGYRARLQRELDRCLPPATHYPARLHAAMRYAVDGGKRLRAMLVYAGGEVLGLERAQLDAPALAVELIHAYSLVHDDLPAMDNDDLRRGRPTTHKAYDEATAILVGDALQALAFEVLTVDRGNGLTPAQRLHMVEILAAAAGSRGMVGGQSVDLDSEHRQLSLAELEALHIHKTGALIRACLRLACAAADTQTDTEAAGSTDRALRHEALDRYGKCIGLAFQIQDDVLDINGNASSLGKAAGKDEAHGKSTYPSVMGLPAARERAAELFGQAREALSCFGVQARPLLYLADLIEKRDR